MAGLPDWFVEREIALKWQRGRPSLSLPQGEAWTVEEYYREVALLQIEQQYKNNPLLLDPKK